MCFLRDPVEICLSHWRYLVQKEEDKRSFEAFLNGYEGALVRHFGKSREDAGPPELCAPLLHQGIFLLVYLLPFSAASLLLPAPIMTPRSIWASTFSGKTLSRKKT